MNLNPSLYIDAVVLATCTRSQMMSPPLLQLLGGAARPHLLLSPPLLHLPGGVARPHLLLSQPLLHLPGGVARPHLLLSLPPPGGAVPHLLPMHPPRIPGGAVQHLAVILKAVKCVRATRSCAKCFCR